MKKILPIIVSSQFLCTSLWFAGNSVASDIVRDLHLAPGFLAHLTSAVQFGFIVGTFIFALLTIADRFSPSAVFFYSALLAAASNLGIVIEGLQEIHLLGFRFFTGFFLAGIYPVGMKIASDYFDKGLGKSLGYLVGALVLGTSFPHLLKTFSGDLPWAYVIYATTVLSVLGGLLIYLFVPDGPYRRSMQKLKFKAVTKGFENSNLRAAVLGYFGHMWELYAFWAFIPIMLANYNAWMPSANLNIAFLSFLIIAAGALSCAVGGIISQYAGPSKVAFTALLLSGICCLMSPFFMLSSSSSLLVAFLFFWGMVVTADSPQFSALVAQHSKETSRGTNLTLVNCLGFSSTIVSIQLLNFLSTIISPQYLYLFLGVGPLIGTIAMYLERKPIMIR
ncbi:MFS transporter [Anditalea andensis]|uniref:MFS transporter n=1 Tax=Anditalea andensis TaxID=1048983 RepID=A0A074L130_9BACT|nr:MFS transporter [Anditalea andensis]KEO73553.1 MFS transporter [Anditalea andensis]